MRRLIAAVVAVLVLSVGIGVRAQEQATPEVLGTPDTVLCATPLAAATGSPVVVEQAPETAATPGGVEPGDDIGLFPCAMPVDAPVGSPVAADATQPAGDTTGAETAPAVVMVDMAFQPAKLTIPADTDVTISITNTGVLVHSFVIDALGIASGDYTSGQTGSVTVNAPAGTYQYYCAVPGHKDIGMIGELTVQ